MDTSAFLIKYLHTNFLLVVGALILLIFFEINNTTRRVQYAHILKIGYSLMSAILLLPFILILLPSRTFLAPKAELWASPSMRSSIYQFTAKSEAISIDLNFLPNLEALSVTTLKQVIILGFLLGCVFVFLRVLFDFRKLLKIIRYSYVIKKIGSVQVLVNDRATIPFSFWIPGHSYVVIPNGVLTHSKKYRMAVLHELQHHRQGDTKWIHLFQILRVFFFINPLIHWIESQFAKIQEFACDEALVDQKRVSPHAYSSYLFEVAKTALGSRCVLAGTANMAVRASGKTLNRRIETMLTKNKIKFGRIAMTAIGSIAVLTIVGTAFATSGVIRDRRISLSEAKEMERVAKKESDFPVVVNERVLEELNRFLGTPDGRKFIRDSLTRMKNYQNLIESKILEYGHPSELIAVPLIESGFQNLTPDKNRVQAAGLWQFITSTARRYNLRVDSEVDERLNVNLETDAAMRYLGANNLRFQDWALAALSYNIGETKVQRGIDATGSRDAWVLIEEGYDNDHNYLPKLMAAILIIRNPSVLN